MSDKLDLLNDTSVPKSYTMADYAKAQLAVLPLVNRTVSFKQKAFTEVEDAAEKFQIPASDLLAWFQAATSI